MFPNVRLLIGTLFIAVLVLSCEFGVFAALRVNREPLSRLTAESAPLQLAAGNNAQPAATMSWAAPREPRAPAPVADAAPAGIATAVVKVVAPAEHSSEALTPSPAAAPMQQAPAQPVASPAPAQAAPVPSPNAAAAAPAQKLAAAPPSLTAPAAEQTPAPAAIAPAQTRPAQPMPDPDASVAKASEKTGEPAARPAELTGTIPNAATPDAAIPEAETPLPKPAPKIAHKPVKKVGKAARKPAPVRHVAKKRIVRQARAPAAASSAQPNGTFDNPVFQTAPQFQGQAKKRPGTKKAATNNNFGNTFGTQFGTQ